MNDGNLEFTRLYLAHRDALERFVFYKIADRRDAQDILQETAAAAYAAFDQLSDISRFRQWIIGVASHKCADYYKRKAALHHLPLEALEYRIADAHDNPVCTLVQDTLELLKSHEKQILYLYYIRGFSQKEIAARLGIP